jgi:acetyl esterase/lipase
MLFSQQEILLYPEGIPNNKDVEDPEFVEHRKNGGIAIRNTMVPTLTIFKPTNPNGKAIVICPGGGYAITAFEKEGVLVAQRLLMDSITSFVLKYRIPQDLTNIDKSMAPLQDAQQAIRWVRKNASNHKIDAQLIGIMGFSAGGHLASSASTHFGRNADQMEKDTTSVRPDFSILIYPVISFNDEIGHRGSRRNLLGKQPIQEQIEYWSNEKQVTSDTPPTFLVHASDDQSVSVKNSLRYYEACLDHGVQAEMHIYPTGGHGFGMYNLSTQDSWVDRLTNWLRIL